MGLVSRSTPHPAIIRYINVVINTRTIDIALQSITPSIDVVQIHVICHKVVGPMDLVERSLSL